jgi:hypothetical protein
MNVLHEFQSAIEFEATKNSEDFEKQKLLPLDERVAKGVTMTNLRVDFEYYDYLPNDFCEPLPSGQKYISAATIYCDNNISKFKEGSPVILSNGIHKFEMDVEEDSLDNFILKPNDFNVSRCYIDINNYPKYNWEINEAKSDATKKMLSRTAEVLQNDGSKLRKIENFLNGQANNVYSNISIKIDYLNNSQQSAYLKAINASDFCIIQGPPGTGKTETIAYITKSLVEQGKKVFITAPTHTAINKKG